MEEFVYQESKELYMAMVRGEVITWPKTCRNCDFEFPSNLKSEISKSLMDEPLIDLLKLTSTTFRKHCTGHNYCCINNFKPSFKRPFCKQDENISYYVFSETLCIEEGLVDWYDVEWPDFDQDDDKLAAVNQIESRTAYAGANISSQAEFSLFNI